MSINTIEETPVHSGKLKYALFIFPALYGFLSLLYYYQSKSFFASTPDPIYAYLANGTNIAGWNFDIGHFDHPGTPVQWLAGLVIFLTHLFVDRNPINESVLSNAEFYLGACTIVLISLLMLSVYASGKLILKYTGNLALALFFQLIPITWYISMTYIVRIIPEALLIICISYYGTFLFVLCYRKNNFPDSPFSNKNFIFLFAFISALLITTKITCIPFIIIPLFFIRGTAKNFLFLIATFVFGLLIIYPVWSKFPSMYVWFNKLATHSGKYGEGKEEIIDKATYLSNLVTLLTNELFFGIGYVLISIAAIAGWIMKKREDNFYKLTLAFWIVCSVQLVLVAKHFGFHYILPSHLLIIPGLIAACMALIKWRSSKLTGYLFLIICSSWLVFKSTRSAICYEDGNKVYKSYLAAKKYENLPKIITTGFQGTCFPESALRFGACYGGGHYYSSYYFLRKRFPNAYFFDLFQPFNYVSYWDIKVMPVELFQKHPKILVYFIGSDEPSERNMISRLTNGFESAIKSVDVIEYNKETAERFYLINVDTAKTNSRFSEKIIMEYDFEKRTADNLSFMSSNGKYTLGEANAQTKEKSFTGNSSIKILSNQYLCCTNFNVNPGDEIEVSANFFSNEKPIGIALASSEVTNFDKNSETIINDFGNGWKQAGAKAVIPSDYKDKSIKFCLFYYGNDECYVDDLKIVISKKIINRDTITPETPQFVLKTVDNKYVFLNEETRLITGSASQKPEQFRLIDIGNGKIEIKDSKGKFVCADLGQDGYLFSNRVEPKAWETFEVIYVNKTTINLKASNGKFVGVDKEGRLIANKDVSDHRTTFVLKIKKILRD